MTTRRPAPPTKQLGLVDDSVAEDDAGYRCIAADPPWQEKGGSRGADKHYQLFRFVSTMVWVKPSMGIGQYLRLRHEILLFGVRGRLHTKDNGVDSVVEAPRSRHSVKPEEAYSRIERVSPGPRLEMFARAERPGWDVWGNEV